MSESLSQRLQSENIELRSQLAALEHIFDTAPIGLILLDRALRYVRINPTMAEMHGLPVGDHIGRTSREVVPDIAPTVEPLCAQVLASGEPLIGVEVHGAAPSQPGVERDWLAHYLPVRDENGDVRGVSVMVQEITGRKQADRALRQARDTLEQSVGDRTMALRESEERFRATFDQAAVGIAHVAPDGQFLRVNKKLCEIVGYGRNELLTRPFQAITHPDDLDADLQCVRQILAGQLQTYSMEKRYIRNDSSIVWTNLTVSLVRDEKARPKYFISVVEDISQRKSTEEQLLAEERLLRRLLDLQEQERRMVAHDIHDGFVQDVVGAHMHLQSLHDAADTKRVESKIALAGSLLEKAIVEGRRLIRDLRPLILDESGIVEAIEHLIADEEQHQDLRVAFFHEGEFRRLDRKLEGGIFRIVQEALSNVRRHARTNRAELALNQDTTSLRIEIRDRGIGFALDQLPTDRFGLSGIRERARRFGGTACIESTPGKGTTVTVRIPLDHIARETEQIKEAQRF